jgi:hypothetical protein
MTVHLIPRGRGAIASILAPATVIASLWTIALFLLSDRTANVTTLELVVGLVATWLAVAAIVAVILGAVRAVLVAGSRIMRHH